MSSLQRSSGHGAHIVVRRGSLQGMVTTMVTEGDASRDVTTFVTLCNFNFYNSERMNEVNFRLGWIERDTRQQ